MTLRHFYFPMALESVPLALFDKLRPGSIMCWEDLTRKFYNNFVGVLTHPSTRIDLRSCQQLPNKSFWDYYRCFAELRSQVFNVTEREVIDHFSNGIKAKW